MKHRIVCVGVSLVLVACGGGGGGGSGNAPPPAPDTTAPNTTLAGAPPALTNLATASISFTATEAGSTFETRLDGAAFSAATSPQSLTGLADGSHTFEVRARDAAGNVDATPASTSWVVDTAPPDTTISAAPSAAAPVNAATFTLGSPETGATFEVSLDGGAFVATTSPHTVTGATDGAHTIRFRARDAAGNPDATPATATFTLDVTPAVARMQFPTPFFYTDAATVTVRGTAADANGVSAVSVNGVAATTTNAFATWSAVIPVPIGTTQVRVRTIDGPGNARDGAAIATMLNRGPMAITPRGIGYDAARDRVIVADQSTGHVYAYRASDGIGQMLSDVNTRGIPLGRSFYFQGIVIDAENDRALAADGSVDGDVLLAIDLATGVRSLLSPANPSGSATRLDGAYDLAIDSANQQVYVAVPLTSSVVRIDLATGSRTVISSGTVGTGPPLANPISIVHDSITTPGAPRLLVALASPNPGLVAIDIATGNRTAFSSNAVGTGPSLGSPTAMLLDAARGRVIAYSPESSALIGVSLANGNRTLIHDASTVAGIHPSFTHGLALKPSNGTLYTAYWPGGVLAIDLATQARTLLVHSNVGEGGRVALPTSLAIEPGFSPKQLLYLYGPAGALFRIDTTTGNRQLISSLGNGTGPSIANALDFVVDRRPAAAGRSILVFVGAPANEIVSVNLNTGVRTHVADVTASTLNGNAPMRFALDAASNRVIYGYNEVNGVDVDKIYAIDLVTGVNTVISDASNTGPVFSVPWWMTLTSPINPTRAMVSNFFEPEVLEVNLLTGNRSLFDSAMGSGGVAYTGAGPLIVDAARSRALVMGFSSPSVLFAKPLAGGSREWISGTDATTYQIRGTGPQPHYPTGIELDAEDDVVYVASSNSHSMIAIDVVSGDRVLIAR